MDAGVGYLSRGAVVAVIVGRVRRVSEWVVVLSQADPGGLSTRWRYACVDHVDDADLAMNADLMCEPFANVCFVGARYVFVG